MLRYQYVATADKVVLRADMKLSYGRRAQLTPLDPVLILLGYVPRFQVPGQAMREGCAAAQASSESIILPYFDHRRRAMGVGANFEKQLPKFLSPHPHLRSEKLSNAHGYLR